MRRVLREHEVGHRRRFYRAARPPQLKNMKFSGKKIIAAKSGNILPYFKVNLSDSQTLPLRATQMTTARSTSKQLGCDPIVISMI